MSDLDQLRVFGSNFDEFSRSLTKAIQSLPPEQRKQLDAIRMKCFSAYGFDETRDRLNNKSVGEILQEFGNATFPFRIITEGERDGVRYQVTEPTSEESNRDDE